MKPVIKIFLALLFLLSLSAAAPTAAGAQGDEGPPGVRDSSGQEKGGGSLGSWLVSMYREHISPVDGSHCPSWPSCSTYAVQAIRKHGFVVGWVMTVDRLIHEGSEETRVSPMIYSRGERKIYDPIENNDFWWYPEATKGHE